jgi:hypothetical protein
MYCYHNISVQFKMLNSVTNTLKIFFFPSVQNHSTPSHLNLFYFALSIITTLSHWSYIQFIYLYSPAVLHQTQLKKYLLDQQKIYYYKRCVIYNNVMLQLFDYQNFFFFSFFFVYFPSRSLKVH